MTLKLGPARTTGKGAFENPLEAKLRDAGVPAWTKDCPACVAWKADKPTITAPYQGERELARTHHEMYLALRERVSKLAEELESCDGARPGQSKKAVYMRVARRLREVLGE